MSKKYKAKNRLRREKAEHLFEMINTIDAEIERLKSLQIYDSHAKARVFALEMFIGDIMNELVRRG